MHVVLCNVHVVCVCVCVRACVRACARACVRACVRARARSLARACLSMSAGCVCVMCFCPAGRNLSAF